MKKLILSASLLMLLFSCAENESTDLASATNEVAHRGCASHDVL